jgi:hypothetical protein
MTGVAADRASRLVCASVPPIAARNAVPLSCGGHIGQSNQHRRVGPEPAVHYGLRAQVEVTAARNGRFGSVRRDQFPIPQPAVTVTLAECPTLPD